MIRVLAVFIFLISTVFVNSEIASAQMRGPRPDPRLAEEKIINKLTLYNSCKYDDKKSGQVIAHEKLKSEIIEAIKFDIMYSCNRECPVQISLDSQDLTTLISTLMKTEEGSSTWDDGVLEYQLAIGISISDYAKIICIISKDSNLLTVITKNQKRVDAASAKIARLQSDPYNANKQGEYDRAINIINASNYFKEGIISGVLKNTEAALDLYEDALKLYPEFSEVYYQRATLYNSMSRKEEAINDYTQAIKFDKDEANYYVARGICYFDMAQPDNAIKDFNYVIESKPSNAALFTSYAARGNIYEMKGDNQKALQDYTAATDINPKASEIYFRKGLLNRRLHNYEDSVRNFDQVIEINKNSPDAYFERGTTYAYLKNKDQVLSDYKEAARLGSQRARDFLTSKNIRWK